MCTYCKKPGHSADICRKKAADKSPSKRKTCTYCKKLGHREDTYRKKADKSPSMDAGNVASTSFDTFLRPTKQRDPQRFRPTRQCSRHYS